MWVFEGRTLKTVQILLRGNQGDQEGWWRSPLPLSRIAAIALAASGLSLGIVPASLQPATAQLPFFRLLQPPPDEFPPSPLELTEADPLLPEFPMERELTTAEKERLRPALDQLRAEGVQLSQAGDTVQAYERWYRELRLRRFLGLSEEIVAIAQVGEIAAQQGQTDAIRVLTERLRAIGRGEDAAVPTREDSPFVELSAVPELESAVLERLGVAYQAVRAPRLALVVFDELLKRDRQGSNTDQVQLRLETIAELHLSWFDYGPAANYYEELLTLEVERLKRNPVPLQEPTAVVTVPTERRLPPEIPLPYRKTIAYLQQLGNIYQRANSPNQAIATYQRLIGTYRQLGLVRPIPALQVSAADSYAQSGDGASARSLYLKASTLAQQIQQFSVARSALTRLIKLYQDNPGLRPAEDAVVQTSLTELELARQAGDGFGMMEAYDRLGVWLRSQGQMDQARVAFEQGAVLAGQLNYRQLHFQRQLQTLENL
ncbi:MAG: tetratricopeptide repeat protein [Cyanobacteria bacterium P01_D01_bin.73]